MKQENHPIIGSLEILTACLIWGYGYVVIKNTLDSVALDNLMTLRYVLAAISLALLFSRSLEKTNRKIVLGGAAMGFLLYASQYAQTAALGYEDTTAGQVAFITALYVVLVPFLHSAMRRSLPNIYSVLAAVLALTGLFLLVGGGIGLTLGCRIAMLGSLGFSIHILVIDVNTREGDPVLLTVWQFVWASVFSGMVQIIHGTALPAVRELPSMLWPLIYLGIFSTMLGFLMQAAGQKRLSPELTSILLATEAVFGMIFSVLLTGESISAVKLTGCSLMLAGVLLAELKSGSRG